LVEGVNVAVVPEYETVPEARLKPCPTVTVDVVIVDEFIVSLNDAEMDEFIATPVALLEGFVNETVGAVVSGVVPVANIHV